MARIKKCKNCIHFSKPDNYELEEEEGVCSLLSYNTYVTDDVLATPICPTNPNVNAVLIVNNEFNCKHYERSSS